MSYPDLAAGPAACPAAEDLLPDDPFTAVNYHFGMLLGVDDFETELGYHRGRDCLQNAWLHGAGVVWGLGVGLDLQRGEVRVAPGLGLDGAGRNLHLDAAACLDPGAWYAEHEAEVNPAQPPPAGADVAFDAHVTASFASCLTRPVPALAEPCAGADVETAASRVWETIDLRLVAGPAPDPADRYRRVRILVGVLAPGAAGSDQEAADARTAVLAAAPADRAAAAVAAFRAMANADAAELAPADGGIDGPRVLTPEDAAAPIVLANITGLALKRDGDSFKLAGGTVDPAPRRSHVATATIEELAAAVLAGAPAPPAGPPATTVTGATLTGTTLVLALSGPLDARSVGSDAFSVTAIGATGWTDVAFADPPGYEPAAPSVTLELGAAPAPPWRVIARGTGPRPLVDAELRELGDGRDFVYTQRS
jgi:hypothetical protein